jgi:hypothetical protein
MPPHRYKIDIRDDDDSQWETLYTGTQNVYTVINLDPSVRYDFRVQAWNSVGSSNWSEVHNVKSGKGPCLVGVA